ncbi:MAG TPA: ABC transporter permease [Thermomicrobiales bacterium]|nr:ABC transporter permease [Thermomicrobiales bacterium]
MSSLGNAATLPTVRTSRTRTTWHPAFAPFRWFVQQRPALLIPAALLIGVVVISLLAGVLAPYDPNTLDMQHMLAKPTSDHWLGTDQLGRDVLSRVLYGGRTTIVMALIGTAAIITLGLLVGLTTGYIGGKLDLVVSTLLTVLLSVPSLLLTLAILGILGTGTETLLVALIGAGWVGHARIFRSSVFSLRESVYVEAAESIGASRGRVLFRHIMPNLLTTVVVLATLDLGALILIVTSLSFLGLGVQPPNADWGTMLNEARTYFGQYPILALAPGICITLVALLCNLIGDAIRDLVDVGR